MTQLIPKLNNKQVNPIDDPLNLETQLFKEDFTNLESHVSLKKPIGKLIIVMNRKSLVQIPQLELKSEELKIDLIPIVHAPMEQKMLHDSKKRKAVDLLSCGKKKMKSISVHFVFSEPCLHSKNKIDIPELPDFQVPNVKYYPLLFKIDISVKYQLCWTISGCMALTNSHWETFQKQNEPIECFDSKISLEKKIIPNLPVSESVDLVKPSNRPNTSMLQQFLRLRGQVVTDENPVQEMVQAPLTQMMPLIHIPEPIVTEKHFYTIESGSSQTGPLIQYLKDFLHVQMMELNSNIDSISLVSLNPETAALLVPMSLCAFSSIKAIETVTSRLLNDSVGHRLSQCIPSLTFIYLILCKDQGYPFTQPNLYGSILLQYVSSRLSNKYPIQIRTLWSFDIEETAKLLRHLGNSHGTLTIDESQVSLKQVTFLTQFGVLNAMDAIQLLSKASLAELMSFTKQELCSYYPSKQEQLCIIYMLKRTQPPTLDTKKRVRIDDHVTVHSIEAPQKEEEEDLELYTKQGLVEEGDGSDEEDFKENKSLQKEEIEGQEWAEDTAEYTEDGIRIDPFNMDQELEQGSFDESGHYVRAVDKFGFHDSWLSGVTRQDISKAGIAHKLKEARDKAFEALEETKLDMNHIYLQLLHHLKPKESILTAFQRLKKPKKKEALIESEEKKRKETVDALTTLSDTLMSMGIADAFELNYEQIVRKLRLDEVLADEWQPGDPLPETQDTQNKEQLWEYKWTLESEEVFGPFTSKNMKLWQKENYFPESVVVRPVTFQTPLDTHSHFEKIQKF